jgi:DNA-directed RNA polymerase specialized sigma24 family protein
MRPTTRWHAPSGIGSRPLPSMVSVYKLHDEPLQDVGARVIGSAIPVFDPNAPSSQRALVELGKKKIRVSLVHIARWSTGSDADAEDLVANAILAVLDPDKTPWISLKSTFLTHMSYVMRRVWNEDMRRARARYELADEDVTRDRRTVSKEPWADQELHDRRSLHLLRQLGAKLIAEIGEAFPVATKSYQLGAAGIEGAEEQAGIIGCTIEEIHEARRTLKHHARRIRDEYDQAEELRMRELRERAAAMRMENEP